MSLASRLDADWSVFSDLVETVTYKPYQPSTDSYGSDITGVQAIGRVTFSREQISGDGATVFAAMRRWHLRESTLNVTPTKRGQIVQANGTIWVVQEVSTEGLGTRYVCETVRLES